MFEHFSFLKVTAVKIRLLMPLAPVLRLGQRQFRLVE